MSVYLLVSFEDGASLKSFQHLLEKLFPHSFALYDYPPLLGLSLPGEKELAVLFASWGPYQNDAPGETQALIVPFLDGRFLPYLNRLPKGKLAYLAEESLGDSSFYESLLPILNGIDEETLLTVKHYIETSGSPSLSAVRLYVHHNTVSYRVPRFETKTRIDLSSYANSLFALSLLRAYERHNGPLTR